MEATTEKSDGNKTNLENLTSHEEKYLSFVLDDEVYGIEILRIREIIGVVKITEVPQSANYLKGIFNLRGKIIPVIDLRIKFGMPELEHTHETCIIVVEVENSHIGMIVDTVSEVVNIKDSEIEDPSHIGSQIDTDFLLGLGKVKDKIVIMLDVGKILKKDELAMIEKIS